VVIDGGDRACVRLLLELRARISGLPAGTVIHLTATTQPCRPTRPHGCHLTGHAYLGAIPAATPACALRTISGPVTTDPASPWHTRANGTRTAGTLTSRLPTGEPTTTSKTCGQARLIHVRRPSTSLASAASPIAHAGSSGG